jgi:hypothetical protein
MILFASAINASEMKFVISRLSPNVGQVYDIYAESFNALASIDDPERYTIHSTSRFPAPADTIYWAFVSESFFEDGQYLINYTPVGGSTPAGAYAVSVVNGMEQLTTLPAGVISGTPPVTLVSNRELGIDGAPFFKANVTACIVSGDGTAHNMLGTVTGARIAITDLDGRWALPLIPSDSLVPSARYRIVVAHPKFGTKLYDNLYIPSAPAVALSTAIVITNIKRAEVQEPIFVSDTSLIPGYCRVKGVILDTIGRPVPGFRVIFGITRAAETAYLQENKVPPAPLTSGLIVESTYETSTERDLDLTISVYPASPSMTITLPNSSELRSVVNGYGGELKLNTDFTYNTATRTLSFVQPFVGIVNYRKKSAGAFSVDLPQNHCFWVQFGDQKLRKPFAVESGAVNLDMGYLDISA